MTQYHRLYDAEVAAYRQRTSASSALYGRALDALPGGDTRTGTFLLPYPTFMARGRGSRMWDVDGNEYFDALGNFTALIHGHAHPEITAAINERAALGTAFPFPGELQVQLAEVIRARIPSLERVRFCNSGTEAVMGAIRAARAFTKRSTILKFEGGYHGSYDAAQVSVAPGNRNAPFPAGVPSGPGLSAGILAEVLVAPYNDLEVTRRIIDERRDSLAAVLMEPTMSAAGVIPADPEFLHGVTEAARAAGALLILDEIITFRLGMGGGQGRFGLTPDLTTLGKIIGGGLPVGAFGGREDVMAVFDPRRGGTIAHSGTFNGNALTMAAGLASLRLLTPSAFEHLEHLGQRLRLGLQQAFDRAGVAAHVTGVGSLAHVHFCAGPVRNYRDANRSNHEATKVLHLGLLNRGISCASRGMFALSTVTTDTDLDALEAAADDIANRLADAPLARVP